jgi:hypothetical protein
MIFATVKTESSKCFLLNDGETTYNCVAPKSKEQTERGFFEFLNMLREYGYKVYTKEL